MPRISPVATKADMAPEHHYVFDQVMQVFGRVRGPFSVLLHSPQLAEHLLPLVPFAREGTIVEPQLRQIAVLSGVRERDANYVWAAQVDASRRAGLREEVIDLLRAKGDPAGCRRTNAISWYTCGSSCGATGWSRRFSTRCGSGMARSGWSS